MLWILLFSATKKRTIINKLFDLTVKYTNAVYNIKCWNL